MEKRNSRYAVFLIWNCLLTALLPGGFHQAVMNPLLPILRTFINETHLAHHGSEASLETINLNISLAQSFFVVGTTLGAILSRFFAQHMSRRHNFVMIQLLNIFGTTLMSAVTYFGRTFIPFIVGRFVTGFCRGSFTVLATLTMAEISHRWSYVAYQNLHPVLFNSGFLLANVFGLPYVFGTENLWPVLVTLPALLSLLFFVMFPWFPDTVTWQIFQENKKQPPAADGGQEQPHATSPVEMCERQSYKLLSKLRCGDEKTIREEFETKLKEILDDTSSQQMSFGKIMSSPQYRRQLTATIVMRLGVQVAGLQILSQYTNTLFEAVGVDQQHSTFYSIGLLALLVVMIVVSNPLAQRVGSRCSFIGGQTIVCIGYLVLIITTQLGALTAGVACVFVIVVGLAGGASLGISVLPSELTTQATRAVVLSTAVTVFSLSGTIVTFVTPYTLASLGSLAYIPFLLCSVFTVIYALFFVPETRKKTSEEIQSFFRKQERHKFCSKRSGIGIADL